jgi:hypothetical protein
LPSSWPKHAKAATLHVISLALFALTQVRGWAANSPIHRVRLASELDQLNSEVAMLREEIRIKDAGMAALVPHRRPHYPPGERIAILQLRAARGRSKAHAARRFLVTDTVSDHGSEYGEAHLEWCDDHEVPGRFGTVGRHGSIAVEERFIRALKQEGLAHDLIPLRHRAFCASLVRLEDRYNQVRPHSSMDGATPDEVFRGRCPANRRRRFEPWARYPVKGACAAPWAPARVEIGARLDIVATPFRGARRLAHIEIRRRE